jgi:hypothetical protein
MAFLKQFLLEKKYIANSPLAGPQNIVLPAFKIAFSLMILVVENMNRNGKSFHYFFNKFHTLTMQGWKERRLVGPHIMELMDKMF